jgi:hypothetical protein
MTKTGEQCDGLLRLASALASNNQHKENDDLMKWLETATVDDLRSAFPVLLNWCHNSIKKSSESDINKNNASHSLKATMGTSGTSGDNTAADHFDPIVLTPTTTVEEVTKEITKVLEEAVEFDAEEGSKEFEKNNDSISSLRMELAGYLHTNHDKMRKVPVVADLERRTIAKIALDRDATNTLNMVNAASQSFHSISQYIKPEEDQSAKSWGIPQINIDLGLGLQHSPADVCKEFISEKKPLRHPFTGEKVGRMEVKKIFPSKRKPVWIEYYSVDNAPLKPDVLAKQGDDLRNDASVTSVSRLCESIWAEAPIQWKLGVPPSVCAYRVLVTAPDAGYLEMVPGKNFLDLSQRMTAPGSNESDGKTGWAGVDVRKLAPSLVGSYIVNFILGVRDRHEDNMMVVGDLQDNPKMMQIDFGYILNEYPGGVPFDMPRLTMPVALVDRFNSESGRGDDNNATTTLMEDLQYDMLAAYLVLRRHSSQLIPFCSHLMSSSYDYKYVESILRGRHVFRVNQSENKVIKWISQKLTDQWAHFYFRREVKQGMVSSYYKFVETMTFESLNINKKDSDNKLAIERFSDAIGVKIKKFWQKPKPFNRMRSTSAGSFDDSRETDDSDNQSRHSVPDVVTSLKDSVGQQKPVFKKSRSQKSFVFDLSLVDDDIGFVDMSRLNERVNSAMRLQRQVSATMIAQKEKHGTLMLEDFGGDDTASANSI